ncbi:MAG: TonB-dependent receptor [Bacteroidales bacterium]|nr:TonB-dependent receptor [Bacteroidales bacterium]
MKRYILFMAIVLIAMAGKSQVLTVKDLVDFELLEFATVSSDNPKAYVITNANGQADISTFEGSPEIIISMVGYEKYTASYEELNQLRFTVFLNPSNITLDQVVVSATRWNQQTRETSAKVTTISAKKVALENPQTAADMLGTTGEVFIQKSQQGGGSPMIRGFATNRLLIAVDGIRMNTAIFRGGNLQNIISLDPFATERAEVLFGPGSVIYGSDAIGGVMSFQTLTPHLSNSKDPLVSGNAVLRFASANNEQTGHVDVNVGWKKWAMVTSFSNYNFGDLRMGSYGPDDYLRPFYVQRVDSVDKVFTNNDPLVQKPTSYKQTNMMQKIRFKPNENWDFNYGFHYSTTTDYDRYDRHIRLRNGLPRSGEWYYGPQIWMMNNLNITHHAETGIYDEATLRVAWQHFEESRIDRDFNDFIRHKRFEEVEAYSANLDLIKKVGNGSTLLYGLEAVINDVTSSGIEEDINTGISFNGPSRYPQSTWASYAAYITVQQKLNEKIMLHAGARYNRFIVDSEFDTTYYPISETNSKLNNGALSGNLGVIINPTERWTISAGVSTGFRSPNVDDIGKVFDSEEGSVTVPNTDLEAEYAYNAEIDAAKVFGDFLKIDITGYYTILENAMVRRDYSINGMDSIMYDGELKKVQAIQNAASANVWGIQAGVEIKLPAGFGISSRFNYQQGEEEMDDGTTSPSRHAAPWFGITRLTYSTQQLRMEFYAVYNGEVSYDNLNIEEQGKSYLYASDENGNPYSPSWYTLNFKANYQLNDQLSVSGGLENITDQRYRPYSSGIAAAGRNFILSLRLSL